MKRFKDLFAPRQEVKTDVMEVVSSSYPKVVQEIHMEFMTAGDRLLESAKTIIANSVIENEDKVKSLKAFGFVSTPEAWKADAIQVRKAKQEGLSIAITNLSKQFPLYKVITGDAVKTICEKYGLVLGENAQYTGFVPAKNLKDIENFFKNHPEEQTQYYRRYRGWNSEVKIITKANYDSHREREKAREHYNMIVSGDTYYGTRNTILNICAPIKDMNTQGYKLSGHRLVKDVPDPIVLLPKTVNGLEMYVILTAWGDEASDPLVVNQNNN